ncbi:hypothetical protein B296_00045970 [Ensete ventricosum]|uniref:Uncharacterized protein n=1 Tax=Ensete ventricosum TaxID=4639 RepID=A0A426X1F7_ENSVE|nr:hypothetical protein B296_00045970 [Ensete ventricosum]
MPMNLKEGDRYVVNHGEGLTAVDFDDYISLVEKESAGMAGMAGRGERDRTLQKGGAQRTPQNQQGKERLVGDQI